MKKKKIALALFFSLLAVLTSCDWLPEPDPDTPDSIHKLTFDLIDSGNVVSSFKVYGLLVDTAADGKIVSFVEDLEPSGNGDYLLSLNDDYNLTGSFFIALEIGETTYRYAGWKKGAVTLSPLFSSLAESDFRQYGLGYYYETSQIVVSTNGVNIVKNVSDGSTYVYASSLLNEEIVVRYGIDSGSDLHYLITVVDTHEEGEEPVKVSLENRGERKK